jgi:hypothetical protein
VNNNHPTPGVESDTQRPTSKPYSKPAIIHELELETRAGSPFPTAMPIIPGEEELLQP